MIRFLRRWRENYVLSNALASIAQPVHFLCQNLSLEIEKKIRKNGVDLRLTNGHTLKLARDAGVSFSSGLFWQGLDAFEPETSKTLRFFFERAKTFVDVGANYGYYSILGALWNPQLTVMSFEPVPKIYEGLTKNIAINSIEPRVSAYPLALSDRTGRSTFLLPPSESIDCESTGTLVPDGWQSRPHHHAASFEVETVRFDDFQLQRPTKTEVIKIDVEDFEANVLCGMEQTILRDRPFIVCEILPREHKNMKTQKIIEALGYTPYWIVPDGSYIRVSRFDFKRPSHTDFLLSPVSVPGEVVTDLEALWNERQRCG
jgi:FkbM family methyltransferase